MQNHRSQYGDKTDEDDIERHSYYKTMNSFKDYKVKDIALAEFGRQEILLAQDEMPALMQLREKYQAEQPLKGAKIMGAFT